MVGTARDRPTIVCGVDDSLEAREALHAAALLSDGLGARLLLVHVAPPPTVTGASTVPAVKETLRRVETIKAEELLAELVAAERLEREFDRRVAFGSPGHALAKVAKEEDADLLVVGCRGRGPLKAMLLGSVSAVVLRESLCPVVLVNRRVPAERERSHSPSL